MKNATNDSARLREAANKARTLFPDGLGDFLSNELGYRSESPHTVINKNSLLSRAIEDINSMYEKRNKNNEFS